VSIGLLSTEVQSYSSLLGDSPRPQTLTLQSQGTGQGQKVVVMRIPPSNDIDLFKRQASQVAQQAVRETTSPRIGLVPALPYCYMFKGTSLLYSLQPII
jgi:hypothetical protein